MSISLDCEFYRKQAEFFFEDQQKYNVLTKGRRIGGTLGMAMAMIDYAMTGEKQRFMWADVTQGNLTRYVERYFLPILKRLPQKYWSWRQQQYELTIANTVIDLRSAERPENMEGMAYNIIGLNEAGIILKGERGRYLWQQAILPMLADFAGSRAWFVGTPKGRTDRDGSDCLYYQLAHRAETGEDGFRWMNIATNENPFLDAGAVEEVRKELPEGPIRDQEFYGKFVDAGSGIIKREWIRIEETQLQGDMVIGVDLAVSEKESADDTAFCCMVRSPDNKYQVIDMETHKLIWPEAKKRLMDFIEVHDCPAYIEDNAQMAGLVDDLKREPRMQRHSIKGVKTVKDKITCASSWISRLENGHLTMLRGRWNTDYMNQLIAFTVEDKGRKDDMIDATSRAYEALSTPQISFGVV